MLPKTSRDPDAAVLLAFGRVFSAECGSCVDVEGCSVVGDGGASGTAGRGGTIKDERRVAAAVRQLPPLPPP